MTTSSRPRILQTLSMLIVYFNSVLPNTLWLLISFQIACQGALELLKRSAGDQLLEIRTMLLGTQQYQTELLFLSPSTLQPITLCFSQIKQPSLKPPLCLQPSDQQAEVVISSQLFFLVRTRQPIKQNTRSPYRSYAKFPTFHWLQSLHGSPPFLIYVFLRSPASLHVWMSIKPCEW